MKSIAVLNIEHARATSYFEKDAYSAILLLKRPLNSFMLISIVIFLYFCHIMLY